MEWKKSLRQRLNDVEELKRNTELVIDVLSSLEGILEPIGVSQGSFTIAIEFPDCGASCNAVIECCPEAIYFWAEFGDHSWKLDAPVVKEDLIKSVLKIAEYLLYGQDKLGQARAILEKELIKDQVV